MSKQDFPNHFPHANQPRANADPALWDTLQGRTQRMTWDDLPAVVRACIWILLASVGAFLALGAGMFALNLLTVAANIIADPLARMPY